MSYVNCPGILPLRWLGIRNAVQSRVAQCAFGGLRACGFGGAGGSCPSSSVCPKHCVPHAELSSPAGICWSLRRGFFATFIQQMNLSGALLMQPVPSVFCAPPGSPAPMLVPGLGAAGSSEAS